MGQWQTREQHGLCGINLLLTTMFREQLTGTRQPGLRKALANVFPPTMHTKIKTELKVTIPTS